MLVRLGMFECGIPEYGKTELRKSEFGQNPKAIFREVQFELKSYLSDVALGMVKYCYSPDYKRGPKDVRLIYEPNNYHMIYPDNERSIKLLRSILIELTFFGKSDTCGVFKTKNIHLYYVLRNYTHEVGDNKNFKKMSDDIQIINAQIANILEEIGYVKEPSEDSDEIIYVFHSERGGKKIREEHYEAEVQLADALKKRAMEDLNKIFL